MARAYAQIVTAIWRDEDFIALPHDEQWMYLLLNTQPDISAAGVLTLAVTRWAKRSPTMKPEVINELLDRLAARRFLVIDRDTDEVLVRTFIRWDRGYGNPKRQPAIRDAIAAVESPTIVAALAIEVERVALPAKWRSHAVRDADSLSADMEWANVTTIPKPEAEKVFPQVDSLSNGYAMPIDSHAASERRVPQPTTHNPQPPESQTLFPAADATGGNGPPSTDIVVASTSTPAKQKRGTRLDPDWLPSVDDRNWALAELPGFDTRREHDRFVDYWVGKAGKDATKLDWGRTWRNWMRTAAERSGWKPGVPTSLPDGRNLNRKTVQHLSHLAAYGDDPDA